MHHNLVRRNKNDIEIQMPIKLQIMQGDLKWLMKNRNNLFRPQIGSVLSAQGPRRELQCHAVDEEEGLQDREGDACLVLSKNYIEFWDEMARTYADWFEPYKQTRSGSRQLPSGSWAARSMWPTTPWTGMPGPGGGTSWPTSSSASRWAMCARSPTTSSQPRGQQVRQCASRPGRQEGRQSGHVPAHDP